MNTARIYSLLFRAPEFFPKKYLPTNVMSQILKETEKFTESNTYISYRCVPAHEGAIGNERAYTLASQRKRMARAGLEPQWLA